MIADSTEILLFVISVLLSGFFSGSESALISISVDRAQQLIEEGGKKAEALTFLIERPSEVLTTILVGNNIVNIFAASLTTTIASRFFKNDAVGISVGITTILILIFGEIIPKTFARSRAEQIAYPVIRILQLFYFTLFPIIKIFIWIIEAVLGDGADINGRVVTRNDIEFMVNKAEKEKTIDSKQIDLLNSILEFPTIKVKDIMVPRTKVNAIKADTGFEDIVRLVREVAHSRYPVYDEDLDSTLGFLHVKDLAFVTDKDRQNFNVSKYINPPFFVYEHMKIQSVFDHMNRNKVHLALVKDENNLVVGILTLEDIMEEIFGEIQDEHDDEDDMIPKADQDTFDDGIIITAEISLRDLDSEYDIEIPLNDNYSTLRGFLLDMLGNNFPTQGNILIWEGFSFELTQVQENEILEVKITKVNGDHVFGKNNDSEEALDGK